MYGSVFIVLSTLEMFGVSSANPLLPKDGTPKARQAATEADLSGYYTCKGQEAGGKNYNGVCVLTKKNDVYVIQWVIGTSNCGRLVRAIVSTTLLPGGPRRRRTTSPISIPTIACPSALTMRSPA